MPWNPASPARVLCLTCWLAGTAGAASLPSPPDPQPLMVASLADLSLEELGDIEVTSVSRRPQPLSDAAAAVYVISADDIRRAGATTLPEALRLAPNLQVAELNNGRLAITARGFNGPEANKLLVLIDGRSVYTPLFAGVFWDVQDVVLQDVARIEVISGPGGTLWGVNAVNGVINIITRPAQETQGELLVAGGGTDGAEVTARHGRMLDGDGALRLHARHFYRGRTELENGQDVRDAWHMSQAGFRADWSRSGDEVSLNGQVQQGEQEQAAPGTFFIRGVPLDLLPFRTRSANVLGHWRRRLADRAELSAQAYVDHTERTVPITFDQRLTIGDIQVQYTRPQSATQAWTLGGEYRVARDQVANSIFLGFMPRNATQQWLSLFAQDDITLRTDLHLVLGTRLESNDYTGAEWLPNARLSWKPSDDHLLWAALSRTVRAPSRIDRDAYVPWPPVLPWPLPGFGGPRPTYLLGGGDEVESETARVLEVGWRGQPAARTTLSVNVFRALYDRLHTQEFGGNDSLLMFAGRMRAAMNGIEAWGTWQPLPSWRLSGGFTAFYQRFQLRADSTDTDVSLPTARGRDPARTWQLRSAWDLPGAQEIDVALRHVAMLPFYDVPSYLTADVRWGWRARPGVELSVTGRDLLGRGHGEFFTSDYRTFRRPGIHLQAALRF